MKAKKVTYHILATGGPNHSAGRLVEFKRSVNGGPCVRANRHGCRTEAIRWEVMSAMAKGGYDVKLTKQTPTLSGERYFRLDCTLKG